MATASQVAKFYSVVCDQQSTDFKGVRAFDVRPKATEDEDGNIWVFIENNYLVVHLVNGNEISTFFFFFSYLN